MLRVRIHRQIDSPVGFELVRDETLTGRSAQKTAADLEHFGPDPKYVGDHAFRIKDGNGGGCLMQGCLLDLKIENIGKDSQTADLYFYADKWRKW